MAYKPFLTAGILVEGAAAALLKLFVAGEPQVRVRLRHLFAVPILGAFFLALAVTVFPGKACFAWFLAATLDHAVLSRFCTPSALCQHVAFPVGVILWFTNVNALCAIPQTQSVTLLLCMTQRLGVLTALGPPTILASSGALP